MRWLRRLGRVFVSAVRHDIIRHAPLESCESLTLEGVSDNLVQGGGVDVDISPYLCGRGRSRRPLQRQSSTAKVVAGMKSSLQSSTARRFYQANRGLDPSFCVSRVLYCAACL